MTAEYRSVQTRMWREDEWFQSQPTDARLLFIYLFTNPSASVSGIYRLPLRTIEFESGLSAKRVRELLAQFSAENKVHYEDGVVWVVKMRDNQLPGRTLSDKIEKHLEGEIAKIPACRLKNMYLIAYGYPSGDARYPMDTLSIPMCTDTITITETETITDTETIAPVGTTHRPKPPTSTQQEMFGAIAETCELDSGLHAKKIGQTAKSLLAAGYTPEQVRQFKAWWLSDAWRYEHTPVPSLKALLDKIQQFKNSADRPRVIPQASAHTNGNGYGTSKVANSLAAVDRVFDMIEGEVT